MDLFILKHYQMPEHDTAVYNTVEKKKPFCSSGSSHSDNHLILSFFVCRFFLLASRLVQCIWGEGSGKSLLADWVLCCTIPVLHSRPVTCPLCPVLTFDSITKTLQPFHFSPVSSQIKNTSGSLRYCFGLRSRKPCSTLVSVLHVEKKKFPTLHNNSLLNFVMIFLL